MQKRTWILAGAAALCLVAVGTTLALIQPSTQTGASGGSSASSTEAGGAHSPGSSGAATGPPPSNGASTAPTPPSSPDKAPLVKAPAAAPDGSNPLEVLPPNSDKTNTLPPSAKAPALLSGPAPSNSSANGELAAGYPAASLPPEPKSAVISSSVSSDGTHIQLSLVATSGTDTDGVLSFYTNTLAQYGYFSATVLQSGATEQSYSGPDGTVTVTAQRSPGGTSYSLFASVVAAE